MLTIINFFGLIILFNIICCYNCYPKQLDDTFDIKAEQAKYPNSEAVYLIKKSIVKLKSDGTAKGIFHNRLKILNERGLYLKDLKIIYSKSQDVTKFKGTVIKTDNKTRKVEEHEILRASFSSKNKVYKDIKMMSINFREASVGYIIDYFYEINYKSYIDLPSWSFDGVLPVDSAYFSILIPSTKKINYKFYNNNLDTVPNLRFIKDKTGDDSTYTWIAKNLPSIPIEPNMPPLRILQKSVYFWTPEIKFQDKIISFSSWNNIIDWLLEQIENKFTTDSTILKSIPGFFPNLSDEKKAKILYEYVRDEFRYIEVNFDASFEFNDTKTIMRRHYGDIKDLVLLLTDLLRKANLASFPVLLRKSDYGPNPDEIGYTLRQFDHMLVATIIKGDTILMDPSYPVCPFKFLPPYAQKAFYLMIRKGNTKCDLTSMSLADSSSFINHYYVQLSNNNLIVNGRMFATGLLGDIFKVIAKIGTKKEMRLFVENYFNNKIPGIKVIKHDFSSNFLQTKKDIGTDFFKGDYSFLCSNYYLSSNDFIFLNYNLLNKIDIPICFVNSAEERIHPIIFKNKYLEFDKITIKIPNNYYVFFIPNDISNNENLFASFSCRYSKVKDEIIIYRYLKINELYIKKNKYTLIKNFFVNISLIDNCSIILKKNN